MAIKKMANGKFKVNVYMGAGNSRYVAYAETKKEALILEQQAKLNKMKGVIKSKKNDYTFEEVYKMWWENKYLVTRHHEQVTLNHSERCFRLHILPYLGKMKIKKITFDCLEKLQILWAFGDVKRNIKPYSDYRRLIKFIKNVMKYAMLKGYISKNPCDFLDVPVNESLKIKSEEVRKSKYYTKSDVLKVAQLLKKKYGMQAYVLYMLIYSTGAAKGEIYPLTWLDIDFENKTIFLGHRLVKNVEKNCYERVVGMKNKFRFRRIPIDDDILMILKEWKSEQSLNFKEMGIKVKGNGFLFTMIKNEKKIFPLYPSWLEKRLNVIHKKYGTKKIVPHGLRHTYVSDMLNNGVNGLIIKSLVGHADTSNMIENVYGHINEQSKIKAVEQIKNVRKLS